MALLKGVGIFSFIMVLIAPVYAQTTFRSVDNPPNYLWSDPNSWDQGAVPGDNDNVLIRNGNSIVMNSSDQCNRVFIYHGSSLTINSSVVLTTISHVRLRQLGDNQTGNLIVNGNLIVGANLQAQQRGAINTTSNITGTGSISVVNNMVCTSDSSNHIVNVEVPINTGNRVNMNTSGTDGELTLTLRDSLLCANLYLQASTVSNGTLNSLDMRFTGAVLNLGNQIRFTNNGGQLLNNSATSSDVVFTEFRDISADSRLSYHDVKVNGSSDVNSDTDLNNIFGALVINSGVALNLNRRTLTLGSGDLRVDGTIGSENNDDSLVFMGSTAQQISGSGSITTEYLVINNSNGVSNSATIDVNRFLTIQSGTFTTGGNVTLKSTSTRTAYLSEIGNNGSGAAISGSLTCERNIDAVNSVGWRNLSSPVQGTTLNDWMHGVSPEGFWLYGFTGSNTPSASGYNSCYQYDPALANSSGNADDGWVAATNTSNSVTPYQAWTVYIGGSSGIGAKQSYDLSVSGTPYSGDITMNSSNANIAANASGTQTWGFIGNPYPSAIAWSNVTTNNVNGTAQIYGLEDFNGYRATNFNAAANRIPPFQGFWVQTTGSSPSVTFEENHKITNNIDLRKSAQYNSRFYFFLGDTAGTYNVGATVELNNLASEQFDSGLDGLVFENPWPLPNLYMMVEDTLITQVNSVDLETTRSIDIYAYTAPGHADQYHLKFTDFPELNVCAYVKDLLLDSVVNIYDSTGYFFNLDNQDSIPRFRLYLLPSSDELEAEHLSCFQSNDGKVSFDLDSGLVPTLLWNGQQAVQLSQTNSGWQAEQLAAGNYTLRLNHPQNLCPTLNEYTTVFEPLEVKAKLKLERTEWQVGEALEFENQSTGAMEYSWNFGRDPWYTSTPPNEVSYEKPGVYILTLAASNGDIQCDDTMRTSITILAPILGMAHRDSETGDESFVYAKNGKHFLQLDRRFAEVALRWELYGLDGKLLHSQYKTQDSWQKAYQLPTDGLSKGLYTVKIHSPNNSSFHRFTVQ